MPSADTAAHWSWDHILLGEDLLNPDLSFWAISSARLWTASLPLLSFVTDLVTSAGGNSVWFSCPMVPWRAPMCVAFLLHGPPPNASSTVFQSPVLPRMARQPCLRDTDLSTSLPPSSLGPLRIVRKEELKELCYRVHRRRARKKKV